MCKQPLDTSGLRGAVLNVGSVLDRSPSPALFGTVAYAASKGAVRAMTLAAAARYAPDRIRFNLLVPGLIDTPMAARATNDGAGLVIPTTAKQPLGGGAAGSRGRCGRRAALSVRAGLALRDGCRVDR